MINPLVDIAALRDKHRKARACLEESRLLDNGAALVSKLSQMREFTDADRIASYIAIRGEIDTQPLMQDFPAKHYFLPVLRGQNMHFAPWQPGSPLVKKSFGLLEPDCHQRDWLEPAELDAVLVPLVVFDRYCNRIGQGGGYYDRTFAFLHQRSGVSKPALLGVAHESQCEPLLQAQAWDVPLDFVVTESSIYHRGERANQD